METPTNIDAVPDDILGRILFHYEQYEHPVLRKSASDDLWDSLSLSPSPKYLSAHLSSEKARCHDRETPLPKLLPSANIDRILQISSLCRRWRRLSRHYVNALLLDNDKPAVSSLALANSFFLFPNLTHLHLSDGRVSTINDAFLSRLASSYPQLKILHIGTSTVAADEIGATKYDFPVTDAGLDLFFQRCSQLEQLSLYCLHPDVEYRASFFQLAHLHTFLLPNLSILDAPEFANLASLTHLHFLSNETPTHQQLANLVRLPGITSLSVSDDINSLRRDKDPHGNPFEDLFEIPPENPPEDLPDADLAQLPLLKLLKFDHRLPLTAPCTNIQRLEIRRMGRVDWLCLPNNFGHLLPSLRELTFHGTLDCSIDCPEVFLPWTLPSLALLESLTISNCSGLSRLPEGFGNLCALQTLVLRKLSLSDLPHSIVQLSALKTLVLHTLPLSRLPDSICLCTSLKTLVLFHLPLTFLPESLSQLTSLETFILKDCCSISKQESFQLPESFCRLTALQTLCIARMPQLRLPTDIGNLFNLQTVFLDRLLQQLQLPATFTRLSSLTRLELSGCMIQELPETLGNLSNLQELRVYSCPALLKLPESLTRLSCLEILIVENCRRLTSIPRSLEKIRKLRLLESTEGKGQGTADLPDIISVLPKLRKLTLAPPARKEPPHWCEKNAWLTCDL